MECCGVCSGTLCRASDPDSDIDSNLSRNSMSIAGVDLCLTRQLRHQPRRCDQKLWLTDALTEALVDRSYV